MRKNLRYLAFGLTVSFSFSCLAKCASFPPPKEAIPTSRTYGTGHNDMWEAVLATLSDLNIQVLSIEKESGTIVAEDGNIELRQFEPGRYDSKYCFCGSPERYHVLKELVGEYTVSVRLDNVVRSSLNLEASYRASIYFGEQPAGWFPCISKGVFEPFFLDQVESRLPAVKSPTGPSRNIDWWKPSKGY